MVSSRSLAHQMFHFEANSCHSQLRTEPTGWRSNSLSEACKTHGPSEAEEGEGGRQKGAAPAGCSHRWDYRWASGEHR